MAKVKEKVSIPMNDFEPQQTYAPGYTPPYAPQSYTPQSYTPQSYTQSYAPQSYTPQSYAPEAFNPEPYPPEPFEPYTQQDGGCCDLDPPPYSCQEVPCDQVDPICMNNNPPVVVAGIFSSHPASTICPCCRQIITTEVVYRVGSLTYAACSGLCLVGCCMGCCLIPFLTNCCKDVDHYCPNCQYHIYRYKRL